MQLLNCHLSATFLSNTKFSKTRTLQPLAAPRHGRSVPEALQHLLAGKGERLPRSGHFADAVPVLAPCASVSAPPSPVPCQPPGLFNLARWINHRWVRHELRVPDRCEDCS